MIYRVSAVAAVCLAASIFSNSAVAAPVQSIGDVHLFVGAKLLRKDDWSPAETEFEVGGEADLQPHSWPIGLTVAYFNGSASAASGVPPEEGLTFGDFKSKTSEVQFGVKKAWRYGSRSYPYVAGGLAEIKAKGTLDCQSGGVDCTTSLSDSALGGWLGGGYVFKFGHFDLGADARYSYAKVKLNDVSVNGGGLHMNLVAGFNF